MPGDVTASDDPVARPPTPRRSTPPIGLLRPVDVPPIQPLPGEVAHTDRRERLQRIVVGTLGGCGLILIAAAGAQVARASASTGSSQPVAVLTRAADPTAAVQPVPPAAPAAAPPEPAPVVDAPSIGTLRLHAPALPGHVWLDGAKIAASSAVVACGKHELRVGAKGRPHDIDVPCGGEFRVTR
jgi:hypothetical protein